VLHAEQARKPRISIRLSDQSRYNLLSRFGLSVNLAMQVLVTPLSPMYENCNFQNNISAVYRHDNANIRIQNLHLVS
jgi:hypothetical protein